MSEDMRLFHALNLEMPSERMLERFGQNLGGQGPVARRGNHPNPNHFNVQQQLIQGAQNERAANPVNPTANRQQNP